MVAGHGGPCELRLSQPSKDATIAALKAEVGRLNKRLTQAQSDHAAAEEENDRFERELSSLCKQLADTEAALVEAKKREAERVSYMDAAVAHWRTKAERTERELAAYRLVLSDLSREKAER